MRRSIELFMVLLLGLIIGGASSTQAAVYWGTGTHTNPISVCFVGSALTSRPDRVEQILSSIKQFEYAANIRFSYLGTCPSPTIQDGVEYYDGDIRVMIANVGIEWGTGPIPGLGCPVTFLSGGSWSVGADLLEELRPCLFNLRLGDDHAEGDNTPYINTTLHEFGHALGLDHEHIRADADAGCTESGYGPNLPLNEQITDRLLTKYDRDSVMHYKFVSCGIAGNYSQNGLSELDRLAIHILYPENDRVAEFVGTTVIRTTDTLNLYSAWKAKGANTDYTVKSFTWKINGKVMSNTSDLIMNITTPGDYKLEFSYMDFLDRYYLYSGTVRILTPSAYSQLMASTTSVQQSLLSDIMVPDESTNNIFLPILLR